MILTNGRRPRKGELQKHKERKQAHQEAAKKTQDGAGPRKIDDPQRHHR